jgi:hypothetical protein
MTKSFATMPFCASTVVFALKLISAFCSAMAVIAVRRAAMEAKSDKAWKPATPRKRNVTMALTASAAKARCAWCHKALTAFFSQPALRLKRSFELSTTS